MVTNTRHMHFFVYAISFDVKSPSNGLFVKTEEIQLPKEQQLCLFAAFQRDSNSP